MLKGGMLVSAYMVAEKIGKYAGVKFKTVGALLPECLRGDFKHNVAYAVVYHFPEGLLKLQNVGSGVCGFKALSVVVYAVSADITRFYSRGKGNLI